MADVRLGDAVMYLRGEDKGLNRALSTAKQGLATLAKVVAATTTAIFWMDVRFANAADNLAKIALRIGTTTEALSEYQYVAQRTGVTFETLTMAWQRMTRRVAEAAKGTGEAKAALLELGMDAQALVNLAPDQMFERLADALAAIPNQADRVRLAMKLFDSEGVALVQMMGDGSKGLQELRKRAREFGLTIDEEAAQKAIEFKDAMTDFKASLVGLRNELANETIPALTTFITKLTRGIQTLKEFRNPPNIGQGDLDFLAGKYGTDVTLPPITANSNTTWFPGLLESELPGEGLREGFKAVLAELAEVGQVGRQVAMDLTNSFGSFLSQGIGGMLRGVNNLRDAWARFHDNMLNMLSDLIARWLVLNAVSGITGGGWVPFSGFMREGFGLNNSALPASPNARIAAPVNVTVNNNSKSDISVGETFDPNGRRQLEILVEDVASRSAQTGMLNKTLRSTFGLAQRTAGR